MDNEKTDNKIVPTALKMRRKVKIYTIIAIVALVFQLLAYVGSWRKEPNTTDSSELIGYYFGFNWLIIVSVILFINVYFLKKKLRQQQQQDMIDSIGRTE